MYKKVIKYFVLLNLFITCSLYGQLKESEDGQSAVNAEVTPRTALQKNSLREIYMPPSKDLTMYNENLSGMFIGQYFESGTKNTNEESLFNVLSSSYRNNIRFGGFWNKYAIINFTPSFYIKPFSSVSVYAIHSYSCFVPIDGIKEHAKSLFIQGAAVLAVDNSIKFLFSSEDIIPKIAGFVFKTIIITEIMKSVNKDKTNLMYENRIFRYSVSIRF